MAAGSWSCGSPGPRALPLETLANRSKVIEFSLESFRWLGRSELGGAEIEIDLKPLARERLNGFRLASSILAMMASFSVSPALSGFYHGVFVSLMPLLWFWFFSSDMCGWLQRLWRLRSNLIVVGLSKSCPPLEDPDMVHGRWCLEDPDLVHGRWYLEDLDLVHGRWCLEDADLVHG